MGSILICQPSNDSFSSRYVRTRMAAASSCEIGLHSIRLLANSSAGQDGNGLNRAAEAVVSIGYPVGGRSIRSPALIAPDAFVPPRPACEPSPSNDKPLKSPDSHRSRSRSKTASGYPSQLPLRPSLRLVRLLEPLYYVCCLDRPFRQTRIERAAVTFGFSTNFALANFLASRSFANCFGRPRERSHSP